MSENITEDRLAVVEASVASLTQSLERVVRILERIVDPVDHTPKKPLRLVEGGERRG